MTSTGPPNRTVPSRMPDPVVVNTVDVDTGRRGFDFNRVSLRAIIAGTIVALITMIALTILGLSVGATTLDALLDMGPIRPSRWQPARSSWSPPC